MPHTILTLPPSLLLITLLTTTTTTYAETFFRQNAEECTCFRTDGPSSGYFTSHRFHDFRNVASGGDIPDLITDATNSSLAGATSNFFTGDAWTSDWTIQSWTNADSRADSDATVLMVNSPNNVYIGESIGSFYICARYHIIMICERFLGQTTNYFLQKPPKTTTPHTQPTSPSAQRDLQTSNPPPNSTAPSKTSTTFLHAFSPA
jgi:hypothetical protein